ncbi:MAG: glucose-1-phosphate adenylyltransferase [Alphaproteobacteria bacterium]
MPDYDHEIELETGRVKINAALRKTISFVLAGGRGSRLMDLTDNKAKPAVPFAGKYRIIDFPLSNCVNSGIRKIVVPTQYKSHLLIQHVYRSWGFMRAELGEFVSALPAQQQIDENTWYRGTADAVWQNVEIITKSDIDYVLILAGDHVYKQDYSRMLHQHIARGADVSVSCLEVAQEEATRFGVVGVNEEDEIIAFQEKPKDPATIPGKPGRSFASMGIYIFNADFLVKELEIEALSEGTKHDFGGDILPRLLGKSKMYAHRFSHSSVGTEEGAEPYWRDVGTIDSYWEANMDLCDVTPELNLYDEDWPIWTYQAQRPSAKFVFNDMGRTGTATDSIVSGGVIVSGSSISHSLLSSNVRVHSYSTIAESVLLPHVVINRGCRLRKCVVDSRVVLPRDMIIGENKSEDAKYFYVSDNGVTLVTQPMVDKWVADHS